MADDYGYGRSLNGRYVLSRDGVEVMRGTEAEVWGRLHRTAGYSIAHALRYEGWPRSLRVQGR